MVTKEKDEELALFLEMRRRERDRAPLPLGGSNGGGLAASKPVSFYQQPRKTAADKFLDSENEKSDYDWLITPPGTPLVPSLEIDTQKSLMNHIMSGARPAALQSRLTNIQEEPQPPSKANVASKRTLPVKTTSANVVNRRPSSSGELTSKARSRPATPTGRPTLASTSKGLRPSTPTSRATLPASRPAAPVRSSTPTRTIPRSSTPTARPSLPATKAMSRSATPTRPRSNPTAASGRSASVSKSAPAAMRNPAPSRGASPTVKCRPWKPNEMPGFSLDAPPNLRTTLPERPASASRGRPGGANTRPSNEAGPNGRQRQQSCSPTRGRSVNGGGLGGSNKFSMPIKSKTQMKSSDDVNPVLMGTQMVERVVNMRKLVPPKQDDNHSTGANSGKSASLDSLGFGRSLSKKSLDMALRHMDIRRAVSGNLRPLMTNIPASSMYSVRSGGSAKCRTTSSSDSPLATRSNASSELSVNNSSFFADGLEMEDSYGGSERGNSSPTSQHSKRFME